jgi:hypothetical protein
MGCCSSRSAGGERGKGRDDDIIAFDYCPKTGAIIPVRRRLFVGEEPTTPTAQQRRRQPGDSDDQLKRQTSSGVYAGGTDDHPIVPRSGTHSDYRQDFDSSVVLYSPNEAHSPNNMSMTARTELPDNFADSFLSPRAFDRAQPARLSERQEGFIREGHNPRERIARLQEVEQITRSEIFGAYLVTSKMLEMAAKRVRPLYVFRRPGARHRDPLASAPTLVIHHESVHVGGESVDGEHHVPSRAGSSPAATPRGEQHHLPMPDRHHKVDLSPVSPAAADANVERLQVLDVSGIAIERGHKAKCKAMGTQWDFLSIPDAGEWLSKGESYFGFVCKPYTKLEETCLQQLETIVNLTGFEDEMRDNGAPVLNVRDAASMSKYTIIMVKSMFVVPGFDIANMNRDLMCSLDYQRNCQPGGPKFWDDCDEPFTFRETKPIIRFVYSMVIQLRVHEITDPELIQSFRTLDGLLPEKALLLERTKRDKNKVDSTAKCKSILLYYRVTGGALVTNITTVVNTSIPSVVAAVVNNFGSQGAKEVGETAVMTREYLMSKFGDSRRNGLA